jgi:hypothetical protein
MELIVDSHLQGVWADMKTALPSGNVEGGADFFDESSKDRFRQAFTAVGNENIRSIFTSITELRFKTMYCR